MRMTGLLLSALCIATLVGGCSQVRNEEVGRLVGGAIGGLIGAQVGSGTGQLAAAAAGALLGSYIGASIGRTMDDEDRLRTHRAFESTPAGETETWDNPRTGVRYAITPNTSYDSGGKPCREFTTETLLNGESNLASGTACRQSDGSWQII